MYWPRITIVTPSFNHGAFLEATIRSVRDQEYPNLEHILVDGGSTDQTSDIIARYHDYFAIAISEPDNGQTDALMKGFALSTGDIQGWLCSDDMLEPNCLHDVAQYFAQNPNADVVYGDATWIDVAGASIRRKREHAFSRFIWMYDHNFIPQPSTFWRRRLYQKVGGLDSRFDLAMDADLFVRFSDVTQLHHVRRLWSRMRLYPEQKNQRLRDVSNREDDTIRRRQLGPDYRKFWLFKHLAAKSLRVSLKFSTGCYW